MIAHCVIYDNPMDPMARKFAVLRRRIKISRLAPRTDLPVIAWLNGRPILKAEWRRRLRDGDHLRFDVLMGRNALAMVLQIALLVAAPVLGAAVFGGIGGTVLGLSAATIGTAAIGLAGTVLISALLPQQQGPGALSLPMASPTYSLQAQGNVARLEQPIPVQYGRMLFSPDLAAQPYTEYFGNEQFLSMLLCLGAGEFQLEDIRIEDTPITAFPEVTWELVAPGAQVTLFPSAVVTSIEVAGQDMPGIKTGSWSRTTTTVTVTETAHGRVPGQAVYLDLTSGAGPTGFYKIASVPTVDTFTVTTASGSGSGSAIIHTIIGGISGFVASGPGTLANRIACDVILPRGLFAESGGSLVDLGLSVNFYAQQIDDNGLPIGGLFTLGVQSLVNRTTTPQRVSFSYNLPTPGRYAVLAMRTDAKSTATAVGHDLAWSGLRAYLREPQSFGPVSLLAVRMRASGSLSALASRRIKVMATRKIPVWTGSAWSAPVATSSIAWAIADAARNSAYGAGMADSALPLADLLALDALWSARGDRFDGRFDQGSTWWEAARKIAAAGRAEPFLLGGALKVVRDGAASVPVAMFTMRSIVRGSFLISYLPSTEATADRVEVSYFDNATWQPQRVTAALPGSAALTPVKVELFGVTDRNHALREGLYLAAVNRYRRRIVTFQTEMEGFIPIKGDLIAVQHDMPAWGTQAEAVAWNAASRTLTLSEPMVFGVGSYYVALRRRDGSMSGPWAVTAGATEFEVVLATAPDITPDVGQDRERTHVSFFLGVGGIMLAKVMNVRPRGIARVEIEAVLEDPSVHTADTGVTAPPIATNGLPRAVTAPVVTSLIGRTMPTDSTRVLIAWQPAPGAETYHVEMAEGLDVTDPNVSWTRVADTTATHFVAQLLSPAKSMIRVRAVGLTAGPWKADMIGTLIGLFWGADSALHWGPDTAPYWSS